MSAILLPSANSVTEPCKLGASMYISGLLRRVEACWPWWHSPTWFPS